MRQVCCLKSTDQRADMSESEEENCICSKPAIAIFFFFLHNYLEQMLSHFYHPLLLFCWVGFGRQNKRLILWTALIDLCVDLSVSVYCFRVFCISSVGLQHQVILLLLRVCVCVSESEYCLSVWRMLYAFLYVHECIFSLNL